MSGPTGAADILGITFGNDPKAELNQNKKTATSQAKGMRCNGQNPALTNRCLCIQTNLLAVFR